MHGRYGLGVSNEAGRDLINWCGWGMPTATTDMPGEAPGSTQPGAPGMS